MNFLPLNSFPLYSLFITNETLKFSSTVQKKVTGIALFAFGCLAMSYLIYFFCCKPKKEVQVKKEEENLPIHPFEKLLSPLAFDQQEKKVVEDETPLKQPKEEPIEGPKDQDINDATEPSLKDTLMELPFDEQGFQKALDIFNNVKGNRQELKTLFTDYFKRALLLPEEKICGDFCTYMVTGQPEIVEMIADTGIELCKTGRINFKEENLILNNIMGIFKYLENTAVQSKTDNNEATFIALVRKILKNDALLDPLSWHPFFIFNSCNLDLVGKLLLKQVDQPWDLFHTLILKSFNPNRPDINNTRSLLAIALPTLQDAQQLEELYQEAKSLKGREASLNKLICEQLSLEHMQMLIEAWHKQLRKEQFREQISEFLFLFKTDPPQEWLRIIENLLSANPKIDIEWIIKMNRHSGEVSQSYFCALYMMRQLEMPGNNMGMKMEKAENGLKYSMTSDEDGDALLLFSSFLAEQCSPTRLYEILCLINPRYQETVEKIMIAILKTHDLTKISKTFEPFWCRFKTFHLYSQLQHSYFGDRVCSNIETEEQLRTVYEAIPHDLSEDNKRSIISLLKSETKALPKEIRDRVIGN